MVDQRRRDSDDSAVQVADFLSRFFSFIVLMLAGVIRFLISLGSILGRRLFVFLSDPATKESIINAFKFVTTCVRELLAAFPRRTENKGRYVFVR